MPNVAEYTVGNGTPGSSSEVFEIIIKDVYDEKNGIESSTIFKSMDTSIEGRCQIELNTP